MTGFAHVKKLPFPAKRSGAMRPCPRKNAGKSGISRKTQRGKLGKQTGTTATNYILTNDQHDLDILHRLLQIEGRMGLVDGGCWWVLRSAPSASTS